MQAITDAQHRHAELLGTTSWRPLPARVAQPRRDNGSRRPAVTHMVQDDGVHTPPSQMNQVHQRSEAQEPINGSDSVQPLDITIERLPITHPDAALLVEQVQQEYLALYGLRDETPIDPSHFDDPHGDFLVGYVEGRPVATGAWRWRTDVVVDGCTLTAEVKRMYVVPRMRGAGLGRAMLAHMEESARATGAEAMVLETGIRQPEAIELYESSGYRPIAGFGFHKDVPLSRSMARSLLPPD